MKKLPLLAFAAALAFAAPTASFTYADDDAPKGDAPKAKWGGSRTLVFGDGVARFVVTHDMPAAQMTFRLDDAKLRLASAPVVLLTTESGPTKVTLVPVETGVWRLSHPILRTETFDGTMEIVVDGKTYTTSLVAVETPITPTGATKLVPLHGGRVISFVDCAANIEVVQDSKTGTLTIYPLGETVISEAPVVTVAEVKDAPSLTVTKVDGQSGVWMVSNPVFTGPNVTGNVQITLAGKPCDAPLALTARGGQIISVAGGPRFEIVRDEKARTYTFYALDEKLDDRAVVIEKPTVVYTADGSPRTVELVPVPNEPRAWRLVGFEAGASAPLDASLRFTLFGKTLSTDIGLSGFGVDLR
jgi:hypothetical protein